MSEFCWVCGEPLDVIEMMSRSLDDVGGEKACDDCKDLDDYKILEGLDIEY